MYTALVLYTLSVECTASFLHSALWRATVMKSEREALHVGIFQEDMPKYVILTESEAKTHSLLETRQTYWDIHDVRYLGEVVQVNLNKKRLRTFISVKRRDWKSYDDMNRHRLIRAVPSSAVWDTHIWMQTPWWHIVHSICLSLHICADHHIHIFTASVWKQNQSFMLHEN